MRELVFKAIIFISFACCAYIGASAQNVQRQGNTFTQVTNKKSVGQETKTQYTYKDSKGVEYPIYLSSTGKAFIKRVSKKTGNEYKQYLPEIGKQINPEAYKEKK